MKLEKIQIKNFRSIEELEIDFLENPRVLVGINEAGKTNILHALRLLNSSFPMQKADIREQSKKGEKIDEAYVLFIFKLKPDEIEEVYKEVKTKILIRDDTVKLLNSNNTRYNLYEICKIKNEGLYEINLITHERSATYWSFENLILITEFKKPKLGTNFTFKNSEGEEINIAQFKLIHYESYKNYIPTEYLEEAAIEDLEDLIGNKIIEIVNRNLPKVIFWEYKEEYLLPPSIPIDTFQTNPNSCIPLKNLFAIANIPENEIFKYISEARDNFNTLRSRLNRVSKTVTEFFRKAWPEYKTIKFSLLPTETNIRCGVEEVNIWDIQKRSDGFKRFISLLISLAMPAKKGLLNNTLILIDDADTNLHPSGSRYLMEQLKKIAQNNYVIYATHSIFMIDKENIRRHYITKKEKEITKIEEASEETYTDEEVLYKALGASVYEVLEDKNVLFEGWTDKKLFEVAISESKNYKKFFKNIGKGHAPGVKSIKNILPILEMGNRKCLIISDSDNVALQYQQEWEREKGWGIWKNYSEILPNENKVSSEDFIKKDFLTQRLQEVLNILNVEVEISKFDFPPSNRILKLKQFLEKQNLEREKIEEIIRKLKELIFEDLKPDKIEEAYLKVVENIKKELEQL